MLQYSSPPFAQLQSVVSLVLSASAAFPVFGTRSMRTHRADAVAALA